MSLIKAISCPDLTPNRHSTIPGKRGRKKAAIARLWALYGAQFGRILPNKSIYGPYFHANRNGRFYGRILGAVSPREGEEYDILRPVSTQNPDLPARPEKCPEKSGSGGEILQKCSGCMRRISKKTVRSKCYRK